MGLDKTKVIRSHYDRRVVSDNDCKKVANMKNLDDDTFTVIIDIFVQMDTDKGGSISVSELQKGLSCVGVDLTQKQFEEKMAKFDLDSNGFLDIVEFTKYCIDAMGDNKDPKGNLMKALQKFDKKKVGYLNDSQIIEILSSLGNEKISKDEAKQIVKDADKNGDGKLQIEEFADFLLQDTPQQKGKNK